jgi:hypothetical protein
VSTIEELIERKSSSSCFVTKVMAVGMLHADYAAPLNPQKLALTSPTTGGHSVGIVRARAQTTEFVYTFAQLWGGFRHLQIPIFVLFCFKYADIL